MMERVSERWTRCKELLRHRLNEEDAATWLPHLELASLSPGKAVFHGVPNIFFKKRIEGRFAPLMRECLAEAFEAPPLAEELALELCVGPLPAAGAGPEGLEAVVAGESAQRDWPGNGETDGQTVPIGNWRREEQPRPGGAEPGGGEAGTDGKNEFAFASCIEGEANTAALALARRVAEAPGGRYNPFYLAGGVGLGKTHLLRVIAAEVARARPGARVVYRTAEAFTNDVLDGIRRKRMAAVRELYRGAELLLLDDVQFLQVSQRSQQELLHTFDALLAAGKQVVFSADRFPGELTAMDITLRTRMEMGLVAELTPPDSKMRLAMLRARAPRHGLHLPEESALLLAEKITSGFRQLEGALVRLAAYASLSGEAVTAEFVAETAAPFFEEAPEPPGLPVSGDVVLGRVCDHFGITMKALRSRGRTAHLAKARRVAAYLLREAGGLSYPEIGAALGDRTHSTMVYALGTVRTEMKEDPFFRAAVHRMQRSLKGEGGA